MCQDSNETDNDAGASHPQEFTTIHVHNDLLELALTIVLQKLVEH
ncbi:MAG TPA: hypothetical protein V6D03_04885 [Candidatus Caenarcaniphilales bacterium]